MKKLLNKETKGITLIVLVITIVILIILAGVLVNLTLGDNGLFTRSRTAKEKYEYAAAKEIVDIKLVDIQAECMTEGEEYTLDIIADKIGDDNEISTDIIHFYATAKNKSDNERPSAPSSIKGMLVSANQYPKFKFLIGEEGNVVKVFGVTTSDIPEDWPENSLPSGIKTIEKFEEEIGANVVTEASGGGQTGGNQPGDNQDEENEVEEIIDGKFSLSYKVKNHIAEEVKYRALTDTTSNHNDATIYEGKTSDANDSICFTSNGNNIIDYKVKPSFPISVEVTFSSATQASGVLFDLGEQNIVVGIYSGEFLVTKGNSKTYKIPESYNDFSKKHHLVVTYTSKTDFKIYADGELITTQKGSSYWGGDGNAARIGMRTDKNYKFNGNIYNLRVYSNKELTQDEVRTSYNADMNGININRSNLNLEYFIKGNENNIPILYGLEDSTGNDNDAKIYNNERLTNDKKGIAFTGQTYADIGLKQNIEFPMSIEMTFNIGKTGNCILFSYPQKNIAIGIYNNYFILTNENGDTYKCPDDIYSQDTKHHLVVNYQKIDNKLQTEIYIDGQKITEKVGTNYWGVGGGSAYIGGRPNNYPFTGTLYNFRIYNKTLSQGEITTSYNADRNENKLNRSNLILEYNVKENVIPMIYVNKILDRTSNKNDGIGHYAILTKDKSGIEFDGSNSYIEIQSSQTPGLPTSVETVFKTNRTNGIIYTCPQNGITIGIYSNYLILTETNSNVYMLPEDVYNKNKKHHLVVVYKNKVTDHEVYLDGKKLQQNEKSDYYETTGEKSYIGTRAKKDYKFSGIIYELNVFNRQLTETEIIQRYQRVN